MEKRMGAPSRMVCSIVADTVALSITAMARPINAPINVSAMNRETTSDPTVFAIVSNMRPPAKPPASPPKAQLRTRMSERNPAPTAAPPNPPAMAQPIERGISKAVVGEERFSKTT